MEPMRKMQSKGEEPGQKALELTLERLLEEHGGWIRRTVTRTCPRSLNVHADEIEQDVRLRLWKVLQRESNLRHPTSYLHRVIATATIDAIRRAKVRREEPLITRSEDPSHPRAIDPMTPQPDPEHAASGVQIGRIIQRSIETLQENRRTAVKLYLQGFTYTEVAELLQWTEAKARNLVSRGMQNLREQLESEGVHGGPVKNPVGSTSGFFKVSDDHSSRTTGKKT